MRGLHAERCAKGVECGGVEIGATMANRATAVEHQGGRHAALTERVGKMELFVDELVISQTMLFHEAGDFCARLTDGHGYYPATVGRSALAEPAERHELFLAGLTPGGPQAHQRRAAGHDIKKAGGGTIEVGQLHVGQPSERRRRWRGRIARHTGNQPNSRQTS